jgi:hypothetical protein
MPSFKRTPCCAAHQGGGVMVTNERQIRQRMISEVIAAVAVLLAVLVSLVLR